MPSTTKPPTALAAMRLSDDQLIEDLQWWALSTTRVGDRIQVRGPRRATSGILWSTPLLVPGVDPGVLRADIMTLPRGPVERVEIASQEIARYRVARREPSAWVPVEHRLGAMPGPLVERLARRVRAWRVLTTVAREDVLAAVMEDRSVVGKVDETPSLVVKSGRVSVAIPMRMRGGRVDVLSVAAEDADRVLPMISGQDWAER